MNATDNIARLLELSICQARMSHKFGQNEVDDIVYLTTRVNPELEMGNAISIYQAGLIVAYATEPDTRHLIDTWCNYPGRFAGLSLTEFLDKVNGANKST